MHIKRWSTERKKNIEKHTFFSFWYAIGLIELVSNKDYLKIVQQIKSFWTTFDVYSKLEGDKIFRVHIGFSSLEPSKYLKPIYETKKTSSMKKIFKLKKSKVECGWEDIFADKKYTIYFIFSPPISYHSCMLLIHSWYCVTLRLNHAQPISNGRG